MPYTTNSLSSFLRGTNEFDPDAAGGSTPDRLLDVVREAGSDLWSCWDWRHRYRQGAISVSADASGAELPTDFDEYDHDVIFTSDDDNYPLILTEKSYRFQAVSDLGTTSSNTSTPGMGYVCRDHARDYPYWYAKITPAADAAYTYGLWYLTSAPWERHCRMQTALVIGTDNDLLFTAVVPGPKPGGSTYPTIKVAYTAGGALAVATATASSTTTITVTYVTGTTTAAQVKTLIDADTTASALIHVDYAYGESGTGTISEDLTATSLTGAILDTAYPSWPRSFDIGWKLNATWMCNAQLGRPELAPANKVIYDNWLTTQKEERDDKNVLPQDRIIDDVGDRQAFASAGFGLRSGRRFQD